MVGFPTVSWGKRSPSDVSSSPIPHTKGTPYTKGTSTPRGLLHQGGPQAETINLSTPTTPTQWRQDSSTERRSYKLVENTWEQVLTIEGDIPKDSVRF